jgi:hypothetical protein
MSRSLYRANLLLGGMLILLAGLVMLEGDLEAPAGVVPLTDLETAAVREIRLRSRAGDVQHYLRSAQGWQMLAPYPLPAEPGRLQRLAALAQAPSWRQIPLPELDPKEAGLDKPLQVALNDTQLEFGGTEPIRQRRYVRIGDRVHLIDDSFYHLIAAEPESMLDPRPFVRPPVAAQLQGMALSPASLARLGAVRAARIEAGAADAKSLSLTVREMQGAPPQTFSLNGDGTRLTRQKPPLTYVLSHPLSPAALTTGMGP